jgi:hypothetical protein
VSTALAADSDVNDRRDVAIVGPQADGRELLPTGKYITPSAAPGSTYQQLSTGLRPDGNADANGAYTSALSPDGKTLLVLTNGYNTKFMTTEGKPLQFPYLDPITGKPSAIQSPSYQWIFVFDVAGAQPVKKQQINIPSSYAGIAWAPDGERFYVSGGQEDRIYIFKQGLDSWVADVPFIPLNHNTAATAPKPNYDGAIFANTPAGQSRKGKLLGLIFGSITAGVAVSQ